MGKMPLDVTLGSNKQLSPRGLRCRGPVRERQSFESKQRQPHGLIEEEAALRPRKPVHVGGEKLHLFSQYRRKARRTKRPCYDVCGRHCSTKCGFDSFAPQRQMHPLMRFPADP